MKKIAVFTSGGDAPGMNACIRAVVRTSIANNIEVIGVKRGYQGMIEGDFIDLPSHAVANIIQRGGTMLKTARSQDFMTKEIAGVVLTSIAFQLRKWPLRLFWSLNMLRVIAYYCQ